MVYRLTMRETATNKLKKTNLDKSESKNQQTIENTKKKNKYPMISNIVINNNNSNQQKPSVVMSPGSNSNANKKKDLIINKIELLDDKKLNKLAMVVEELSNNKYNDETGSSIFINSKKFDEANQFNFNSNEKVRHLNKHFS